MIKEQKTLRDLAHARSGDKGRHANIGIIAKDLQAYEEIKKVLTEDVVKTYFKGISPSKVIRYELKNLLAFNFVLYDALGEGGTSSLRSDSQGKALGEALLHIRI